MWIKINGELINSSHLLKISKKSITYSNENVELVEIDNFEEIKKILLNQNKNNVFISYKDIEGKIWKRAKSEFKNYKTRCICCKKIQVKYFGAYCTSCFNWCAYKCYFLLEWKDKIKELKELK